MDAFFADAFDRSLMFAGSSLALMAVGVICWFVWGWWSQSRYIARLERRRADARRRAADHCDRVHREVYRINNDRRLSGWPHGDSTEES